MAATLCKNCGKQTLGTHAGSVTSYFFKHKFCHCQAGAHERPVGAKSAGRVCSNCGKSKSVGNRLGSLTSFLFQDLKCECGVPSVVKGTQSANGTLRHHTRTADRALLRKQFTESLRNKLCSSDSFAANAILEVGTTIGGVFSLVSLVGVGGMGAVYLAEHCALHKQFALKVMWPGSVNQENWSRFMAEAQIIASLNHRTLVKVYDLGLHENSLPYYSMDYLNGRTLEEVLIDDGPLLEADAIDIYLELLDGLAYAHRNGIVHRDLKPANIMLCLIDGAMAVKILDFGISKLNDSAPLKSQYLTVAGDVFGSPFYMSPEQCAGEPVDARSDIYSLGCSLFETLTGCVPFEGSNSFEIMLMHQEEKPPQLADMADGRRLSPAINLVVAKCLAKKPAERYQSAKELAIDLARAKEGRDLLKYSQAYPQAAVGESASLQNKTTSPSRGVAPSKALGFLCLGVLLAASAWAYSSVFGQKKVASVVNVSPSVTGLANEAKQPKVVDLETAIALPIVDGSWIERAERDLRDCEIKYGPDHPNVVRKLNELASTFFHQGDFQRSEALHRRLVDIYSKKLGPSHEYVLLSLNAVASSCESQGKFAEAEFYYKKVLAYREKSSDRNPQSIAWQLNRLATLYRIQKKFDLAEPLYKRSIALDPECKTSSSERSSRQNYAFLLRKTHREKEADQLENQSKTGHSHPNEAAKTAVSEFESIKEFLK